MAERLSAAPLEWKHIQESFKARRIMADGAIAFAGSEFVFAGQYGGTLFEPRVGGDYGPRAAAFRGDGKG